MYKLTMSERTTSIVSALVALAILGLGVTAKPTADPTSGRIEALESDLRFQIEMSWRHDGRTRGLRTVQLEETLAAWNDSPQSLEDRVLLENWLRAAIVDTLPGESGEFPPMPKFSVAKPEAKPKPAVPRQPQPSAETPAAAKPPTPKPKAAPLPRDHELKPGQAYTPPRAKEIRLTPRVAAGAQPTPSQPQAADRPPAPAPPIAVAPPKRVIAAKPVPKEDSVETAPAPQPAVVKAPMPSAPPVEEPQLKPSLPPTDNKPAVAEAPLRELPAPVDPAQAKIAPPVAEQRPAIEPPPEVDATPVMVNLAELNAQITGYHEGLHEIAAKTVARRGKLTEGEIARLVGQLEQLAGQYQFVRLYYDGLTPRERRLVRTPERMTETIALVETERQALTAEDEDFLTALEEVQVEDELARRLKTLAEEVDEPPPPKLKTNR